MFNRRRALIATASKSKGHNLPAEYQRVEYIESTGEQYIITPMLFPLKVDIDFNFTSINPAYNAIIGAQNSSPPFHSAYIRADANATYISTSIFGSPMYISYDTSKHNAQIFFTNNIQKRYAVWDGVNIGNYGTYYTDMTTYPLYLFASNNGGNPHFYSKAKIYKVIFADGNDDIMGNFVPCYRKTDNEPGLYDIINNVFYTNAGTGTFIIGPDVN